MPDLVAKYLAFFVSETGEFVAYGAAFVLFGLLFLGPAAAVRDARANVSETRLNLVYFFARLVVFAPLIIVPATILQDALRRSGVQTLGAPVWAVMPLWLQALAVSVVLDGVTYWRHRILHWPAFWPIHAIHHSDTHVQWHTGLRFHPVESFAATAVTLLVPLLCGAPVEAVVIAELGRKVWGYFAHTRVPWTFGPLQFVLVSPVQHQWHHVREGDGLDKNFATMWSFWDVLFGTYYVPHKDVPPQGISETDFPTGIVGQTVWPILAWTEAPERSSD